MSYYQPALELANKSASGGQPPVFERPKEVAKLIDVSKCIGCKACQVACMEWNELRQDVGENVGVFDNPHDLSENVWTLMRFTEYENTQEDRLEWLIRKDGCMHCADPGCLKACPAPGAIVQYSNGIVDFISDNCIGCGYCVKGCPFNIPRIAKADNKAYKCSLCSDRVANAMEPACAKACPTHAISFGSKDEMIALAQDRVADLKERGFAHAGLYDPPGVNGTHVMYVLQHADRPSLYAGLPDQPRISPLVEAWKGMTKVVGLAAIAGAALFGGIHYALNGPNRVSEEDEESAANLTEKQR